MIKKLLIALCAVFFITSTVSAYTRGIYINGDTIYDTKKLEWVIDEAQKYKIDTFIIDIDRTPNKTYRKNVQEVLDAKIHYVARLVVFPGGGTSEQVANKTLLNKRLALAKHAVALGASAIQLDYVRFVAQNPADPAKAIRIAAVVDFFNKALQPVPVQVDIFGISSLKPTNTIGQNPQLLATVSDALCPMVYPSHFEPYLEHSRHPYRTIFNAITSLKKQLVNHPNVAVYAYIESYNYRYPLTREKRVKYILDEMKGAEDAHANGWYVWSPNNTYETLFDALKQK